MKEEIKNEILRFLVNRAPNDVRGEIITRRLNRYSPKEIEGALEELVTESKLKKPLIPKDWEGENGITFRGYGLTSYENIPSRRTIKVGDTQVLRILRTDLLSLSPEDINEAIETLSEYSASLENRFSDLLEKRMRNYWGNVVMLFGIFVAIFSFIIVALPRISFPAPYDFLQILLASTAQVLPVAGILALFICVLRKLFR